MSEKENDNKKSRKVKLSESEQEDAAKAIITSWLRENN